MAANLSLKRKGFQEPCDLNAMDGALPGVGHMTGSETFPDYPVSSTLTCEGVVWIRWAPATSPQAAGFAG